MDISLASWFVILLALAAANLPFLSERLFALVPLSSKAGSTDKSMWWRLLELLVLYFVVGFTGRFVEGRTGDVFTQTWEFYAIGAVAFIVLAYPGFAFRYLRKRNSAL
ncbi:DUF2818 family protein [Actimicrobium sp. CCI2.3]|uniref:DUF2818 family protein n=1 Tax=Actimicrobium sp. CCI2.3 TaxID=3048616 RepID=UPI002AB3609B|nr:DUF2818 family protein [Actimicrobium sp. CCI2.3]MDY7574299.1 DUF2818 family protein [Actimicrobium sp. CCI2.3]MEB0022701.1 DUF2818 family protein [Actimicrobium sp. CCI2.3]